MRQSWTTVTFLILFGTLWPGQACVGEERAVTGARPDGAREDRLDKQEDRLDRQGISMNGSFPLVPPPLQERRADSVRSLVGVRIARQLRRGRGSVILEVRLRWAHEFVNDDRQIRAAFDGTGAGAFIVRAAPPR